AGRGARRGPAARSRLARPRGGGGRRGTPLGRGAGRDRAMASGAVADRGPVGAGRDPPPVGRAGVGRLSASPARPRRAPRLLGPPLNTLGLGVDLVEVPRVS